MLNLMPAAITAVLGLIFLKLVSDKVHGSEPSAAFVSAVHTSFRFAIDAFIDTVRGCLPTVAFCLSCAVWSSVLSGCLHRHPLHAEISQEPALNAPHYILFHNDALLN